MLCSIFKSQKKQIKTKTFTYFIPAPPDRRLGYQEKEFDNVIHSLTELGYEVISLETTAYGTQDKAGMWIVCLVGTDNEDLFNKKISIDVGESGVSQEQYVAIDPDIIHES